MLCRCSRICSTQLDPMPVALELFMMFRRCMSSSTVWKLKPGDILRQKRTFTNEDVIEYSKVSHDSNPLHFDSEYAQKVGFERRLVHGMLVASLFPHVISSHFPGAAYVSQNLIFKLPVYIGDQIMAEIHTKTIRENKNRYLAKFNTKCFKSGEVLVLDGLDQMKQGRGQLVTQTIAGTLAVLLCSTLYSIAKTQERLQEGGMLNPTDEVLTARRLLEASLMGFSMFLGLVIDRLHFYTREILLLKAVHGNSQKAN